MALVLKWYLRMLKVYPWRTQALTAGVLMASGDVICQTAVEKKSFKECEQHRTLTFGVMGTCFVGPLLKTWYQQLENIFGVSTRTIAVKKMLLDQFGFAPLFICAFLVVHGTLQNKSWKSIQGTLQKDYITILSANYMVWPMAQLVTFYAIPPQHRILFVSLIALFWNTYLAWKTNQNSIIDTPDINCDSQYKKVKVTPFPAE